MGQLKVRVILKCGKCGGTMRGTMPAGWGHQAGDVVVQDHIDEQYCELVMEQQEAGGLVVDDE